jgi:hypothetical protein
MSNRKNYNSIVFLTTLSVYLGLVLAGGAAPSVMAQAALTRDFDIKRELVVEDDLDKKPDDKDSIDFESSLDDYFGDVGSFVEDLQKLHQIGKFDLDYDKFEISELGFVPCDVNGDPVRTAYSNNKIGNRWLEPALTDARYKFEDWNFLADCFKNADYSNEVVSTASDLKLSYDKAQLKVELSAFKTSPHRAEQLAANFSQAFKVYEVDEDEPIVKKIYENTTFKSENNQVFIVTRLPRAALDDSPAEK